MLPSRVRYNLRGRSNYPGSQGNETRMEFHIPEPTPPRPVQRFRVYPFDLKSTHRFGDPRTKRVQGRSSGTCCGQTRLSARFSTCVLAKWWKRNNFTGIGKRRCDRRQRTRHQRVRQLRREPTIVNCPAPTFHMRCCSAPTLTIPSQRRSPATHDRRLALSTCRPMRPQLVDDACSRCLFPDLTIR